MKTIKTTILTLLMIFACNAFNILVVDSTRYWVRDIDSMHFSPDRDTMYISVQHQDTGISAGSGIVCDTYVISGIDTMYFSDTGYISRYIPTNGVEFIAGDPAKLVKGSIGRKARITKPFWMDATEVTQGEYKRLLGINPIDSIYYPQGYMLEGDSFPVYGVTYFDAALYCNARSKAEGLDTVYTYDTLKGVPGDSCWFKSWHPLIGWYMNHEANGWRLPSEAQWEWAARNTLAGGTKYFWWGERKDTTLAINYAWYNIPTFRTHTVATKLPSPWGLYDMHGNCWELCSDLFAEEPGNLDYYTIADPLIFDDGGRSLTSYFVIKSGSYFEGYPLPTWWRAYTYAYDIEARYVGNKTLGFRCVRPVE